MAFHKINLRLPSAENLKIVTKNLNRPHSSIDPSDSFLDISKGSFGKETTGSNSFLTPKTPTKASTPLLSSESLKNTLRLTSEKLKSYSNNEKVPMITITSSPTAEISKLRKKIKDLESEK